MVQRGRSKPLDDLVGDTEQRYTDIGDAVDNSLGPPRAFLVLGSRPQAVFSFLSRRKQEEMKSRNQDFKAAPAWSISSGQMKSGPGVLPGFIC